MAGRRPWEQLIRLPLVVTNVWPFIDPPSAWLLDGRIVRSTGLTAGTRPGTPGPDKAPRSPAPTEETDDAEEELLLLLEDMGEVLSVL